MRRVDDFLDFEDVPVGVPSISRLDRSPNSHNLRIETDAGSHEAAVLRFDVGDVEAHVRDADVVRRTSGVAVSSTRLEIFEDLDQ
jgi:hypothetical protein